MSDVLKSILRNVKGLEDTGVIDGTTTNRFYDLTVQFVPEEDKLSTVGKVGQNVTPKLVDGEILRGCGVIISVEESKYNVIYKVLTDFGNVVTLSGGEFHKQYEVNSEDVVDIEERIQIQMDKLTNAWIKLKVGEYNEQ